MRRFGLSIHWLASLVIGGVLASCGSSVGGGADAGTTSSPSSTAHAPVAVVATTTQVADFVRVIGGDDVHVYGILKPNVDAHDVETSPADLEALRHCVLVFENGVGLEPWLAKAMAASDSKATLVDSSSGVTRRGDDPHIWQDPHNAAQMVTNIEAALAQADPADAATFAANLVAYRAQLDALDREIAIKIGTLSNPKLVSNHDAFAYYVARYGLTFVGSVIPSFDSQAELSASELQQLVAKIEQQGVKAVFSETSLPAKTAETIAKEAGVKVVEGDDALYGDSLGPAGSAGDTYLKMMRHNTDTIVENLR